jgi:peptidoglycan/LPS O-acetylase OafA/YrhL/glycosyltransferase involved in cell wall biosynthesis
MRDTARLLPFLRRRVERIYPAFLAVFLLYLALSAAFPVQSRFRGLTPPAAVLYALENLLLLPGVLDITPVITVAWSLSYELFFYIGAALLIRGTRMWRWKPRARVAFFAGLGAAYLAYSFSVRHSHVRALMFVAGILLYEALASERFRARLSRRGEIVTIAGFVASLECSYLFDLRPALFAWLPAWWSGRSIVPGIVVYQGPYKTVVLIVGVFWWVAYTVGFDGVLRRGFVWAPLRYLGNMSYSYYLLHGITLQGLALLCSSVLPAGTAGPGVFLAALPIGFAMTWCTGTVLFEAVEKPLSLAKRHPAARPAAAQTGCAGIAKIAEIGQAERHGTAEPGNRKPGRILMVSTSCPFPPTNGYAMRLIAILKGFASQGWETALICFGDPAQRDFESDEFRQLCYAVNVVPHPRISMSAGLNMSGRLAALFSRRPYAVTASRSKRMEECIRARLGEVDAVICEETNLLANLPLRLPVPLIVDHHNVEYVLLERYIKYAGNPFRAAYAWLEARKTRRWEREACSRAAVVLACSELDRAAFRELHPGVPVIVAPNVIDVSAYLPSPEQSGATLLYAGGMDWFPNRDAVDYFVHAILPAIERRVPGVRFRVAGRSPSEKFRKQFDGLPNVGFTGSVPDMRTEIAKTAVCVVPLRIGSGTRLKILEAAAMGKAIVSTSLGAEGLAFAPGEEILIADAPEAFAAAVAGLLENPARRRDLGSAARRAIERQYDLPAMQAALREALGCLGTRKAAGSDGSTPLRQAFSQAAT